MTSSELPFEEQQPTQFQVLAEKYRSRAAATQNRDLADGYARLADGYDTLAETYTRLARLRGWLGADWGEGVKWRLKPRQARLGEKRACRGQPPKIGEAAEAPGKRPEINVAMRT